MQLNWLPQNICDNIDQTIRNFIWRGHNNRGVHLVNWKKIASPKQMGGSRHSCSKRSQHLPTREACLEYGAKNTLIVGESSFYKLFKWVEFPLQCNSSPQHLTNLVFYNSSQKCPKKWLYLESRFR